MDNGEENTRSDDKNTSRRALLKAVGAATIGSLVAAVAPAPARASVETVSGQAEQPVVPLPIIEGVVKVALESPLLKRELAQLQEADLIFDLTATAVKLSSTSSELVGLLFETVKTPSPRYGANLLITFDTKSNALVSLQYVISWSLLNTLEVMSVIFNGDNPLEIDLSGPGYSSNNPRIVRPQVENHWSFPRAEVIAPHPGELIEFGWPPESPDFPRWYFGGTTVADWLKLANTTVYATTTMAEVFSDQSRQSQSIEIRYSEEPTPEPVPTPQSEIQQP